MSQRTSFNLDEATANPAGVFEKPMDVVNHPALTVGAKFKVLEQWERDARALAIAENEGMTGGEESMLGRVRKAMRELDTRANASSHQL